METTKDERPTDELVGQVLELNSEEDGYWDILTVLWRRATTDTLSRARQLCASPNASERKLGADVLGQLGTKPDVLHEERLELLLALLSRETEPDVLAAACIGLSHLYDPKADGLIIRLKGHPDEDVRYSVAVGLTGDPDDIVTATLIELSADVASDVRDWATFRLGMMEAAPPEVLDALVERVADEDEDTRAEAIVGLSRRKDQRALEPLIECLNQLKAGESQGYDYAEGLLYEAAAELENPRLCPALLKLESRTAVYGSLSDAIVKCGCNQ